MEEEEEEEEEGRRDGGVSRSGGGKAEWFYRAFIMADAGCCLRLRRAADEWATQKGTLRLNRLSMALGRTAAAATAE